MYIAYQLFLIHCSKNCIIYVLMSVEVFSFNFVDHTETQYIQDQPSAYKDSLQDHSQVVESDVPIELVKEFDDLSRGFIRLNQSVRHSIEQYHNCLNDLQDLIRIEYCLEPLSGEQATVDNVLKRLTQHYCLLNVRILELLVETLPDKGKCLQQQVASYIEQLKKFKSHAKMKYLVDLLKEHQAKKNGHKLVKLKVREFWEDITLKRFEEMLRDILQTLYCYTSQMKVEKGCICISWVIPDMDTSKLISPQPLEFLKIIGVVYLHIGDEVVYSLPEDGCDTLEAAMLQAVELKNTQAIQLLQAVGSDNNDIITKSVDNVVSVVSSVTDNSDTAAVTSSSSSSTERERVPVVSTHSQSIQEPLSTQPGHHTPDDVFTQEEPFKITGMNITFL